MTRREKSKDRQELSRLLAWEDSVDSAATAASLPDVAAERLASSLKDSWQGELMTEMADLGSNSVWRASTGGLRTNDPTPRYAFSENPEPEESDDTAPSVREDQEFERIRQTLSTPAQKRVTRRLIEHLGLKCFCKSMNQVADWPRDPAPRDEAPRAPSRPIMNGRSTLRFREVPVPQTCDSFLLLTVVASLREAGGHSLKYRITRGGPFHLPRSPAIRAQPTALAVDESAGPGLRDKLGCAEVLVLGPTAADSRNILPTLQIDERTQRYPPVYYRAQLILACLGRKWCDVVVRVAADVHSQRVYRDEEVFDRAILPPLLAFHSAPRDCHTAGADVDEEAFAAFLMEYGVTRREATTQDLLLMDPC